MDSRGTIGRKDLHRLMLFSQKLWGNQDRLPVAYVVSGADPADLYAQKLADRLGISDTRVGPHLARLESQGLLVKLPRGGGSRRVYYQRSNDGFWEGVAQMGNALLKD